MDKNNSKWLPATFIASLLSGIASIAFNSDKLSGLLEQGILTAIMGSLHESLVVTAVVSILFLLAEVVYCKTLGRLQLPKVVSKVASVVAIAVSVVFGLAKAILVCNTSQLSVFAKVSFIAALAIVLGFTILWVRVAHKGRQVSELEPYKIVKVLTQEPKAYQVLSTMAVAFVQFLLAYIGYLLTGVELLSWLSAIN